MRSESCTKFLPQCWSFSKACCSVGFPFENLLCISALHKKSILCVCVCVFFVICFFIDYKCFSIISLQLMWSQHVLFVKVPLFGDQKCFYVFLFFFSFIFKKKFIYIVSCHLCLPTSPLSSGLCILTCLEIMWGCPNLLLFFSVIMAEMLKFFSVTRVAVFCVLNMKCF